MAAAIFKKCTVFDKSLYMGVFQVAEREFGIKWVTAHASDVEFAKFKMADQTADHRPFDGLVVGGSNDRREFQKTTDSSQASRALRYGTMEMEMLMFLMCYRFDNPKRAFFRRGRVTVFV